jgi:hypothetical protein
MAVDKFEDVIDSRDVIARIEELEYERDDWNDPDSENELAWEFDNTADAKELLELTELAEQGEQYSSDWRHGEGLIRNSYWVDYVEELCKDIGAVPQDVPHYIEINWNATADNIAYDYAIIDYAGVDYYIRSS